MTTIIRLLAFVSLLIVVVSGIYAAQPWGDNYAYQKLSDYLMLFVFLLWAVSPYLYFLRKAGSSELSRSYRIVRLVAALLVCGAGIAIVVDAMFIHPDAQGGLVFLFIPLYQWIAIGIFAVPGIFLMLRSDD